MLRWIRSARKGLGLSQMQLAVMTGLSLPTVQAIEAGKANPEWNSVTRLVDALGLSLGPRPQRESWDWLAACGAPLVATHGVRAKPTEELLIRSLRICMSECMTAELDPATENQSRERDALAATLLAIKIHYPRVFSRFFGKSAWSNELVDSACDEDPGRVIKLSRLALARISEFL